MQILPDDMAKSMVKGQFQGQICFFQQIKVKRRVIPLFYLILTGKSISDIIFMIQGQHQGRKVIFKVNLKVKYVFSRFNLGTRVIPLFRLNLTGKFISDIIFMIQAQHQGQIVIK